MVAGDQDHVGHYTDAGLYWESLEDLEEKWDIRFIFCKRITPRRQ